MRCCSSRIVFSLMAAVFVLAVTAGQPALAASYEEVVKADNPVGYWRFEETTGTNAADSSGNGRDGTYQDGVTLGAAGAAQIGGKSASFNGSTFVDLPGTWGGGDAVTVEAWVKPASITGDFQAIVAGHDPNAFVHFQLHSAGNTGIYTDTGFQATPIIPTEPLNEWRHVAIVGESGNSRVYVDGVQLGDPVTANFASVNASDNVDIGIGHVNTRWFDGDIDEVAIYDTALSDATIAAHHAAGVPEPSSLCLLGLGLGGLVGLRRRGRNLTST